MFIIRNDQLAALDEANQRLFEDRVLAQLGDLFPQHFAALLETGEEAPRQFVRDRQEQAAGYGIEDERDVMLFVNLIAGLHGDGERLEDLPWIGKILDHPEFTGHRKLVRIYQRLEALRSGA
jgi:hypothetical protein